LPSRIVASLLQLIRDKVAADDAIISTISFSDGELKQLFP